MKNKDVIEANERVWDSVADQFINASSLPDWGPFGVGSNLNLLPKIKNKVFLEVGCGSGRSIKYLTDRGAKKVYGLDISTIQLEEALSFNNENISKGTVTLVKSSMEEKLELEPVDCVISVYAIGWTLDPERTLANIFSYLKPGGILIWSWDHSFFSNVGYVAGLLSVTYSYHTEDIINIKNWKKEGVTAHIAYRKTSTWFQLMRDAGFEVVGYYEPEPVNTNNASTSLTSYYSLDKAKKVPSSFIFVGRKN